MAMTYGETLALLLKLAAEVAEAAAEAETLRNIDERIRQRGLSRALAEMEIPRVYTKEENQT